MIMSSDLQFDFKGPYKFRREKKTLSDRYLSCTKPGF